MPSFDCREDFVGVDSTFEARSGLVVVEEPVNCGMQLGDGSEYFETVLAHLIRDGSFSRLTSVA
jgi:hypothetical protein